jgi:hypothetical protein
MKLLQEKHRPLFYIHALTRWRRNCTMPRPSQFSMNQAWLGVHGMCRTTWTGQTQISGESMIINSGRKCYPSVLASVSPISFKKKLCAALLANEELAEYADDVKILSTAESAASDRRYHVVVALLFEAFCIVVDCNLHSTAILIPLGGKVETEERILLNDRRGTTVYRYTHDQTGEQCLTYCFAGLNVRSLTTGASRSYRTCRIAPGSTNSTYEVYHCTSASLF